MPTDTFRRGDAFGEPIQVSVGVTEPFVPQALPREQLRILDQQSPERHERSVGGALPRTQRRGPALERQIAVPRALDVDPFLTRGSETVGAEAGDHTARARAAVARDRKSTRLNSSHLVISYAVFCLKKKKLEAY